MNAPKREKVNLAYLISLLGVIFIDILGASFIIPLLNPLIFDLHYSILPLTSLYTTRTFFYGITLGIYSIATFFGAPILGGLSDKLGRKKILYICLMGSITGYGICILGVKLHCIFLLIIGRMITGLSAGSLVIAQAALLDISDALTKTTYIGYMLFSIYLGYLIGPVMASVLSHSTLKSLFNFTIPLYFCLGLLAINIILIKLYFKDPYIPHYQKEIRWFSGLSILTLGFKNIFIRPLSCIFLFLQLSWAAFIQFIGLFLSSKYNFNPTQISIFLMGMGIGFMFAFFYLLPRLTRYFSFPQILLFSIGALALCLLAFITINNNIFIWMDSILIALAFGTAFLGVTSLFAHQAEQDKQGGTMGLMGAIAALSFGVMGLVAGILIEVGVATPIKFSLLCVTISALITYQYLYKKSSFL